MASSSEPILKKQQPFWPRRLAHCNNGCISNETGTTQLKRNQKKLIGAWWIFFYSGSSFCGFFLSCVCSVFYGSFLGWDIVREGFVIECASPSSYGRWPLFIFRVYFCCFFFFSFDYLISWTAEFLILHSSIFWLWFILTVLSTKTGSRRREETWPQLRANDQFRFLEGKKKILVNEHKRAGDSIGKRQLPQISLFFL